MKKGDNMKKNGFTIIEVALVLGIAGLIFLMMMIALPALQRQQRDTARKEDIDSLIANIKKYQTNNRGALPGGGSSLSINAKYDANSRDAKDTWNGFLRDYMTEGFSDPSSGDSYNLKIMSCSGGGEGYSGGTADAVCVNATKNTIDTTIGRSLEDNNFTMLVITSGKCAGDETVGALRSSNPRKVAILYKLEGVGLYCANT